jgi:hypothetical protein
MKDLKKILNLICLLAISFLILPKAECDAQNKKMSDQDLTNESTAVLYGKCSKIRSEWNENKSIIYTYITIIPEEYIKGNLGPEAVIAVPGGRVDDIIYEVSEMPVFTEGEEAVVFIWTNPAGKNLVTGGFQGKMKIEKDSKTGKRMVEGIGIDLEPDKKGQGKAAAVKPEKVSLEDFVVKLKAYVKN